ncbi:MAG TPA: hypothetical protein VHE35_35665 [Kofleriaceae bacterium]|nr:hypothetical protein [Kofleriaceae bacterium]
MRTRSLLAAPLGLALAATLLGAACNTGDGGNSPTGPTGDDDGTTQPGDEWDVKLGERVVDYNAALRIASLRLTGELPMLADVKALASAANPSEAKAIYEATVRSYMDPQNAVYGPRFARQMLKMWQDVFKMGGNAMLDTAPTFAARMTVENRPFADLFTASADTCPTFNGQTGAFTSGDCMNGVTTHAGVLTNPGVMSHYYSNLAFRRVRWVQETFDCTAFPAEIGAPEQDLGAAEPYTSPWPFDSIAGTANGGTINFLDTSAVVCAKCHSTINHIAPLFGNFDEQGQMKASIQVHTPNDGAPLAVASDWLPPGQTTAWRFGVPAPDLPALGQALAADPKVAECAVARMWNYAMGAGDIVDTLSVVPSETIAAQVAAFQSSGGKMRDALYSVFTADDFVKF